MTCGMKLKRWNEEREEEDHSLEKRPGEISAEVLNERSGTVKGEEGC